METDLSDAELSRKVAEALGWKFTHTHHEILYGWRGEVMPGWVKDPELIPAYATDIGAAMGLLDPFVGFIEITRRVGVWEVEVWGDDGSDDSCRHKSLSRAICLCWLAMKGQK